MKELRVTVTDTAMWPVQVCRLIQNLPNSFVPNAHCDLWL
jgi:hypothetical protein